MIRRFIAAFVLILFMSSTAFAAEDYVDWGNNVIRVTGWGIGPENWHERDNFYRIYARQAAQIDALRRIAEFAIAFQITPSTTVRDLMLENDAVNSALTADVNPLRPMKISTNFFSDGTCSVVMEVRIFGKGGSLAEVMISYFKEENKIPFAKSVGNVNLSGTKYTGLIIDCRGLPLNPAMLPLIKRDNGQAIYSHQNIDNEKIIADGLAVYTDNASDQISRSRSGNNPLVVRAIALSDLNATPVISAADADKILAANQRDKFLENCAVVFVR